MAKSLSNQSCSAATAKLDKLMVAKTTNRKATKPHLLFGIIPPSGSFLCRTDKCGTPSAEKKIDLVILYCDVEKWREKRWDFSRIQPAGSIFFYNIFNSLHKFTALDSILLHLTEFDSWEMDSVNTGLQFSAEMSSFGYRGRMPLPLFAIRRWIDCQSRMADVM